MKLSVNKFKIGRRIIADRILFVTVCLLAGTTSIPLLAILCEVLYNGYDQFSWAFFTEPTPTAYKALQAVSAGLPIPGGIANGIVGTLIILGMAILVAVPVGILCGIYLAENSGKRYAKIISYMTDLLQGTPSVIIGIITYIDRKSVV